MEPKPAPRPPKATVLGLKIVKDRLARLRLRCEAASLCKGKVKLIARLTRMRVPRRDGRWQKVQSTQDYVIATASFAIAARKTRTLRLKLDRAAPSLLRRKPGGHVRLLVGGAVRPRP
jgi:hypothetical protein